MDQPNRSDASFSALLQRRAADQPEQVIYSFLVDGLEQQRNLTYGELHEKARAIAAELQFRNAEGERALLLYPPGLEFIAASEGEKFARVVEEMTAELSALGPNPYKQSS